MSVLSGILLAFLPAAAVAKLESPEFEDPEVVRLKGEVKRLEEALASLSEARDEALRERNHARDMVSIATHSLAQWRERAIDAEMRLPLQQAQVQQEQLQALGVAYQAQAALGQRLPYQPPSAGLLGLQSAGLAENMWRHCTCIPDRSTALREHRINE